VRESVAVPSASLVLVLVIRSTYFSSVPGGLASRRCGALFFKLQHIEIFSPFARPGFGGWRRWRSAGGFEGRQARLDWRLWWGRFRSYRSATVTPECGRRPPPHLSEALGSFTQKYVLEDSISARSKGGLSLVALSPLLAPFDAGGANGD